MSAKTFQIIRGCIRCGGSSGPDVIPGDTVKVFLAPIVTGAPEWVEGIVAVVEPYSEQAALHKYTIQYDSDDLNGVMSEIRDCEVSDVLCEGCCKIISDYLDLMAGVNIPSVQLSYEWNGTSFVLSAHAYSTQIENNPGQLVTIDSYVFKDPNDAVISGTGVTRTITPSDSGGVDWPGGLYTVLVTGSDGLANEASIFVAPRQRFKVKTVTLLANTSTISAGLSAGEYIVGIQPTHCTPGFFTFAPTEADASVIQASAAPGTDLPLRVTIHTP